ncbi:MAG: hypothetical protein JKY70_13805 [Mucilaginibacter sp.]|nr:hypothetical protein [Mucilaginibacter sp.]
MKFRALNIFSSALLISLPLIIFKFSAALDKSIALKVLLSMWAIGILSMFLVKVVIYRKIKKSQQVVSVVQTSNGTSQTFAEAI